MEPFVTEGDPQSGLLPVVNTDEPGRPGAGDSCVQAYNFRHCLTSEEAKRISFEKPHGYDPMQYEWLARYLASGWDGVFRKFDPIQGNKVDMNNHGAVSSDYIGANHGYPNADYATREKVFQAHVTYQKGLMWFLANDSRVPSEIREKL